MIKFQLDEFFDTKSIEKVVELYERLTEQRFFVKDLGLKYRVINHWDASGLIHSQRNAEGGDRKFSFADYVWVKIVEELRSFGVAIPTIKAITGGIYETLPLKEFFKHAADNLAAIELYNHADKEELKEFLKNKEYENADFSGFDLSFLHLLLADTIAGREAVSLIVFKDGEWFPFFPSREHLYTEELLNKRKYSSHISVCLLDIIFRFLGTDLAEKALKDMSLLSEKEEQLLEVLNNNNYKKINISFKSKKHEPLEIKKGKNAKEQVISIIRDKEYKDFFITDNKGVELKVK